MKKIAYPLILLVVISLAGCESGAKKLTSLQLSYVPTSVTPEVDQSTAKATGRALTESAEQSNHMLNRLSAIQLATHPLGVMRDVPLNARRYHLTRKVNVDWFGPMLPVIKTIAHYGHYNVRVLGNNPAIPPIVDLHMKETPLAYILRNIQYQVQPAVRIKVFPRNRTIEVRYVKF